MTIGAMEIFRTVDNRLCQHDEAESISEALRRAMRHMTLTTLTSETPKVAKVLTTEVVLRVLAALAVAVALIVLLTVLNIDESILHLFKFGFALSILYQYPVSTAINVASRVFIDDPWREENCLWKNHLYAEIFAVYADPDRHIFLKRSYIFAKILYSIRAVHRIYFLLYISIYIIWLMDPTILRHSNLKPFHQFV